MSRVDIVKGVVGLSMGVGVTTIVNTVVKTHVVPKNILGKIVIGSGRIGIGMLLSDAVRKHTDAQIDDFVTKWNQAKAKETNGDT